MPEGSSTSSIRKFNESVKRILLMIFLHLCAIGSFAQNEHISIDLKDTTLEAIFDQVRMQADINFIYNHEELDRSARISVRVSGVHVEEFLEQCLGDAGMTFKKINNTYIITPLEDASIRVMEAGPRRGTLRGTVYDRDSRLALPFANVLVMNSEPPVGATTDANGNFRIEKLPVGRYSVKVSYVGYQDAVVSEIFVGSSKEAEISVGISERSEAIDEVSIEFTKGEALNQMATVSARSFSVEETRRYAAAINDPARMVLVFAGVAGNDDATNEIVIRGNSPNWVLWRLEGVEIPSPNHFSEEGYTSGAVSILSSDLLTTSDFYTGAFPAEFGNALSGVFDLRLRNGNSDTHEFTAQAGFLGLDFAAEGPFKKGYKGSYLMNYRYSTLSLLNLANIEVSKNALPNYQDLSFKFNLPTEKAGVFSIWGIGGLSDDAEKYLPDSLIGDDPSWGYSDHTQSGMYATGLTHTYFPDHRSYIRTVISRSYNFSGETYEMMDSLGQLYLRLQDELRNTATRITSNYNRKISNYLTFRSGFTLNHMNFRYYSRMGDINGNYRTVLNGLGTTNLLQGYIQAKSMISEKIMLSAGLHYAYFQLSRDHSIEPRFGLQYSLASGQKISFGYGLHSKNENLPTYFIEVKDAEGNSTYPNRNLDMTRSAHYVAGYEKMFSEDIQLKTEVYYQKINNLPVPNNPAKYLPPSFSGVYPDDTLVNIGEARNLGAELTLQKFFTRSYYLLLTGSLFDSKYKPAIGTWYNTKFNINHILNLVGGKEFEWDNNKLFRINSKIIWTGGKRLIPIDLEASKAAGQAVFNVAALYSTTAPDYFRIDLGMQLHLFKRKAEHILSLDIQNITNRRNIWAEEYDPLSESLSYYTLTGIIPILNYRVEF